jgi:hypothetical protein
MQIEIDNRDYKKPNIKKTENPIWAVVWRFLLVCAIFDGGIYVYFHYVQNITVSEGIRRIRLAVHGNTDQYDKKVVVQKAYQQKIITNKKSDSKARDRSGIDDKNYTNNPIQQSSMNLNSSTKQSFDKLYCWVDENGILHFSNIGFPANSIYKVVNCER